MIDTVECLENFRQQASRQWEFFMKDMVVDLTDDAETSAPSVAELTIQGIAL